MLRRVVPLAGRQGSRVRYRRYNAVGGNPLATGAACPGGQPPPTRGAAKGVRGMAATRLEQAREQLLVRLREWTDRLLDLLTEPGTPVHWQDEAESPPFWWEDHRKLSEVTDRGLFLDTPDEMIRAARARWRPSWWSL